jgi:hypothetical protein
MPYHNGYLLQKLFIFEFLMTKNRTEIVIFVF